MISVKRFTLIQIVLTFLCTAIVICGVSLSYYYNQFLRVDNFLYDLRVAWRGPQKTSGNIVLVLMDEKSALELQRRKGSWSRKHLSMALDHLCRAEAEIIGLDMIMSAPSQDSLIDTELADQISLCNNIILARAVFAKSGQDVEPLDKFQEVMIGDGFINFMLDSDEILRRIRFIQGKTMPDGNLQLLPAFSLELARTFLNVDFDFDFSSKNHLIIGSPNQIQLKLPQPDLIINFYGDYTAFTHLSYADVVKNRFPKDLVKGKIIIIGSSLATQKDFFSTPFSRFQNNSEKYKDKFGKIITNILGDKDLGMACHAHAVETILNNAFINKATTNTVIWLVILFGLVGLIFYLPRLGMIWELLAVCGGTAFLVFGGYLLFLKKMIWLDIAALLAVLFIQFIAGVILQKVFNKKKTAMITSLFGKYVSPGVVSDLIKGDIDTTLTGQSQDLTMLFSDLRSFTNLSEKLGAKDTSILLNIYFDAMIPIVFQHKGTLDKLMGDAVMAFYGAPLAVPDHPVMAAKTALVMLQKIEDLKANSKIKGAEDLSAGIGLNTGVVTVGNLGSNEFMDYTIIGDAVNLASRLEGLNKVYGTKIIISEFTADRLDNQFLLRELDLVRVKGKNVAVKILELKGYQNQMSPENIEMVDLFEKGLSFFRNRQWDKAEENFKQSLNLVPEDGPSLLYLSRIKQFRENTPDENWDGVTGFDHK